MFALKMLFLLFVLSQFSGIFCDFDGVKILKTDMNKTMEHFVIAEALLLDSETDSNVMANKISDLMNTKYGKSWNCIIGLNTNFSGMHIESEAHTFIWFEYDSNNFIVFKQNSKPLNTKIIDIIVEARKSNAKIVYIKDYMAENMKNWIIPMVHNQISSFDTFESISEHVVQNLEGRYDKSWFCLIGSTGNDATLLEKVVNSTILSFKIESLHITIFQIKEEIVKCDKTEKFSDILEKAKTSEPEALDFSPNLNETDRKTIMNISSKALQLDFQNCAIFRNIKDCYHIIADSVEKQIHSSLTNRWIVTVGQLAKCRLYSQNPISYFVYKIGDIVFNIEKH